MRGRVDEESHDENENLTWCDRIPQRYTIVLLLFFILAYKVIAKSVLKMELKYVQQPEINKSLIFRSIVCEFLPLRNHSPLQPGIKSLNYNWTKADINDMFHIHFIGYHLTQPIFGFLSDRFIKAPKILILVGILGSNFFHLLVHSIIVTSKDNVWLLKMAYGLFSLSQAGIFPTTATLISHWVPLRRRAFFYGFIQSGLCFGTLCSLLATSAIIEKTKLWSAPSYLCGGLGLILAYAWYRFGFSDPFQSEDITKTERKYLDKEMGSSVSRESKPVPIFKILTSLNVWIIIVGHVGPQYFWNFSTSTVNRFIKHAYRLYDDEVEHLQIIASAICVFALTFLGFLSDWLVFHNHTKLVTLRKMFTNIGTMGPPVYALAATYAGCDAEVAVFLMTTSKVLGNCVYIGIGLLLLDLAPNYSGFLTSLVGFFNISSVLAHDVKYLSMQKKTLQQHRELFRICIVMSGLSNFVLVLFGHVEVIKWNFQKLKIDKSS